MMNFNSRKVFFKLISSILLLVVLFCSCTNKNDAEYDDIIYGKRFLQSYNDYSSEEKLTNFINSLIYCDDVFNPWLWQNNFIDRKYEELYPENVTFSIFFIDGAKKKGYKEKNGFEWEQNEKYFLIEFEPYGYIYGRVYGYNYAYAPGISRKYETNKEILAALTYQDICFINAPSPYKILNIPEDKWAENNFALIEDIKWIDECGQEHVEDLYIDIMDALMKDWYSSQKVNDRWWQNFYSDFSGMEYEDWIKLEQVPVYCYKNRGDEPEIKNIVRPIFGKYDIFG